MKKQTQLAHHKDMQTQNMSRPTSFFKASWCLLIAAVAYSAFFSPAFAQTSTTKAVLRPNADSNITVLDTGTDGVITFTTNNVERMRISATGSIGMGTNNPLYKLDVVGSGGANQSIYSRALDGSMTRLGLENTNRHWAISNYGTQYAPNGAFVIEDETIGAPRFTIDTLGNIGIGKDPTTAKVDVNGTVKATKIEAASAAYVHISLAVCGGGPCGSYHGGWADVGGMGHPWTTNVNTDPTVLTHNGTGRVTVNQAGTYKVILSSMTIPAATTAVPVYVCPFINGGLNCNGNGIYANGLYHSYYPAGWWGKSKHEFVYNLAAGTHIGYGYQAVVGLSYWAHDGYTALEVVRIN